MLMSLAPMMFSSLLIFGFVDLGVRLLRELRS